MRLTYHFLFVLMIFSCVENKQGLESSVDEIVVTRDMCKDYIRLSDIFEKIEYIPLKEEWPLGNIDKVELADGHFIIFDKDANFIGIFDRAGHFIRRIGKTGRGPAEYPSIIDFAITDQDEIVILSINKILTYSFEGDFIKEVKTPTVYMKIEHIDSDQLILYSAMMSRNENEILNSGCPITIFDNGFDCIETPVNSNFPAIFYERNLFSKQKNSILFSYSSCDTIFEYTDSLRPKYQFKFDGDFEKLPPINFKTLNPDLWLNSLNDNPQLVFHSANLFHNDHFLFTNIYFNGTNRIFVNTQDGKIFMGKRYENDLDHFVDFFHTVAFTNEYLLAYFIPSDLPQRFYNQKSLLDLDTIENPVLMKLYFKS